MKICHVAPELLPVPPTRGGAIERWIRDAAGRLVRRGHDVHVISRDHGNGETSLSENGVQYHFVHIPPTLDTGLPAAVARGLVLRGCVRCWPASVRMWRTTTAGPQDCGCAVASRNR